MKIALQIVLMIFMVLYLGGGIGAKKTEERIFNLVPIAQNVVRHLPAVSTVFFICLFYGVLRSGPI